jgi:hypothetical protein
VLVVDLSNHTSQDSLNADFLYWRQEVSEITSLWRSGLHVQSIKDTVMDLFDNMDNTRSTLSESLLENRKPLLAPTDRRSL